MVHSQNVKCDIQTALHWVQMFYMSLHMNPQSMQHLKSLQSSQKLFKTYYLRVLLSTKKKI